MHTPLGRSSHLGGGGVAAVLESAAQTSIHGNSRKEGHLSGTRHRARFPAGTERHAGAQVGHCPDKGTGNGPYCGGTEGMQSGVRRPEDEVSGGFMVAVGGSGPKPRPGARSDPARRDLPAPSAPRCPPAMGRGPHRGTGAPPDCSVPVLPDYLRAGPLRPARYLDSARSDHPEDTLPHAGCPVLLAAGAQDPLAPPGWIEQAKRQASDGRAVTLPGAHGFPATSPGRRWSARPARPDHRGRW